MSMSASNSIRKPPSEVARRAWRSIQQALPVGEPVGHHARLERADERVVERLGDEHTGAGVPEAAVAATQAQSSPHGPSTGSPLSCSAAACSCDSEHPQLDQLASGRADLGGDQLMEAPLHRAALITVPDRDQIGDLLQRAAELLRPGDERQPGQRLVVVHPVAGVGSARRVHQADAFVIAQHGGAEPAALRHLADRVAAHPGSVKVRPGLKVKREPKTSASPQRASQLTRKARPRPSGLPPEHTLGRPGLGGAVTAGAPPGDTRAR